MEKPQPQRLLQEQDTCRNIRIPQTTQTKTFEFTNLDLLVRRLDKLNKFTQNGAEELVICHVESGNKSPTKQKKARGSYISCHLLFSLHCFTPKKLGSRFKWSFYPFILITYWGPCGKNTGKAEDFVKVFCVLTGFPGPFIKNEYVIYPLRCKINMLNPQNVGLVQMNRSCRYPICEATCLTSLSHVNHGGSSSSTRWGPLTTISGFIHSYTHLQPWLNRVCWGYNYLITTGGPFLY